MHKTLTIFCMDNMSLETSVHLPSKEIVALEIDVGGCKNLTMVLRVLPSQAANCSSILNLLAMILLPDVHLFSAIWVILAKSAGTCTVTCRCLCVADSQTIRMHCHPVQTNWCLRLSHPHHFYARCPSWHNPPNLSWFGTGTKYAGLHTWWLSSCPIGRAYFVSCNAEAT